MSFYRKIKYFLVHGHRYTNKQAQELIEKGCVEFDGNTIFENCVMDAVSEIKVNGVVVRAKKELVYLKLNKPVGFESTLSEQVENNLLQFFAGYNGLSIAGRLDKQSQGLLLLSNDGTWVENVCNPKFEKEKEYLVTLNKMVTADFITAFETGVRLGDCTTLPCKCSKIGTHRINVVLKEGKNRQIRRMCWRLGYAVIRLERIRISTVQLGDLKEGEVAMLDPGDFTII